MEEKSCKFCDTPIIDIPYEHKSIEDFDKLVSECESKHLETSQGDNGDEIYKINSRSDIIKWLLTNASGITLNIWDIDEIVQECENYDNEFVCKLLRDYCVYVNNFKTYKEESKSALSVAAKIGNPDIIKWLVEQGAGNHTSDSDCIKSAIFIAAENGKIKNLIRLFNSLVIEKDFDYLYETCALNSSEKGHFEIVKWLYDRYLTDHPESCITVLNNVIECERYDIAKWIMEKKCVDVTETDYRCMDPIHCASKNGKIEVIKWLIQCGVKLEESSSSRYNYLHLAIQEGHLNLIKWLVKKGFDITERNVDGLTPLHIACKENKIDVVKYLIHIGANISEKGEYGITAIHYAAESGNLELLKFIIKHGGNINSINSMKYTPLHSGAKHLDIVKYLVENGCDIHVKNEEKQSVLALAAEYGNIEIVEWLLKETNLEITEVLNVASHWLPSENGTEMLKLLLNFLPKWDINGICSNGDTLLSTSLHSIKLTKMLLENKADINALDSYKNTPLSSALSCGYTETAEILLNYEGIDINNKNSNNETVLSIASYYNRHDKYIQIIKKIVELGGNVNEKNDDGYSILHKTVANDNFLTLKYLLSQGADVNVKNNNETTVLQEAGHCNEWKNVKYLITEVNVPVTTADYNLLLYHAFYFKDKYMIHWLISNCPDADNLNIEIEDRSSVFHEIANGYDKDTYELIELALKYGADINGSDWNENTMLHNMITHYDIVKLLIDKGANVNATNSSGETVLHLIMIEHDNIHVNKLLSNIDDNTLPDETRVNYINHSIDLMKLKIITLLLNHGANPNAKDNYGKTCLHLIDNNCKCNQRIIELLIKYGADINAKDNKNNTILHTLQLGDLFMWLMEQYPHLINCKNSKGETILHSTLSKFSTLDDDDINTNNALKCMIWLNKRALNGKCVYKDDLISSININNYINCLNILLKAIKNIDEKDNKGNTALHFASGRYGNLIAFKILLQYNANVNALTNDNKSILHIAVAENRIDIIKYIISLKIHTNLFNVINSHSILHTAVTARSQGTEIIKLMLENGVDVNAINDDYKTSLHIAVIEGELDHVKILVENGADILRSDNSKMTPIQYAIKHYHIEILSYLIEQLKLKHTNYNEILINMKNDNLESLLHIAIANSRYEMECLDIVKFLIKKQLVIINLQDKLGKTALHHACKEYMFQIITILLNNGANVNTKDSKGNTALHVAVKIGSFEIIEALVENDGDINVKNNRGNSSLQLAAAHGKFKIVKYFFTKQSPKLNIRNKKGLYLIHNTAMSGGNKLLEYLLNEYSNEININCISNKKQTPLQLVLKYKKYTKIINTLLQYDILNNIDVYTNNEIHIACKYASIETMKLLIDKKADVNYQNKKGNSALHIAIKSSNLETIQLLVSYFNNKDLCNNEGLNILHFACKYVDNIEIIKYLIEVIGKNSKTSDGNNIIHTSLTNSNNVIFKYLVENESELLLNDTNNEGDTVLLYCIKLACQNLNTIQYLLEHGSNINDVNNNGDTCLHIATNYGRLDYVHYLLETGTFDVNVKNNVGLTSLHIAAECGYTDFVSELYESGANVNLTDECNRTALHIAVINNKRSVIRYLLNNCNCDLSICDKDGNTFNDIFVEE